MVVYWKNYTDCINLVNQVQLVILHPVYHMALRGCAIWNALSHLPFRLRSLRVPGRPIRGQITTSCDGGAYCDEWAVPVGAQDPEVPVSCTLGGVCCDTYSVTWQRDAGAGEGAR